MDTNSNFLELYFLGRCFREFETRKMDVPRDPCRYIVGYFGQYHVKEIIGYMAKPPFNALFIDASLEEEGVGRQCIDMMIDRPMF